MSKRAFVQAVEDATYPGSRRQKQRYEYNPDSKGGFVEFEPNHVLGPHDFRSLLQKVPGVREVILQTKGNKTEQGNKGGHCQPQNFLVRSTLFMTRPFEMELTRYQHSNAVHVPFTVTAMFKEPPNEAVFEAWRIFR